MTCPSKTYPHLRSHTPAVLLFLDLIINQMSTFLGITGFKKIYKKRVYFQYAKLNIPCNGISDHCFKHLVVQAFV